MVYTQELYGKTIECRRHLEKGYHCGIRSTGKVLRTHNLSPALDLILDKKKEEGFYKISRTCLKKKTV